MVRVSSSEALPAKALQSGCGAARDWGLSHRGAWRPCLRLPVLSVHPLQLPLLPQPPLPEVRDPSATTLARRPRARRARRALLSCGVHAASWFDGRPASGFLQVSLSKVRGRLYPAFHSACLAAHFRWTL